MSDWIKDHPLTDLNTFGISAKANYYASFRSAEELGKLLQNKPEELEPFILGGGSNMLLTGDLNCLVLHNQIKGIQVIEENGSELVIEAKAGENWHEFVQYCVDKNWRGIENLSLIPGCVGAAPIQNIGAYGVELKDCFHSLDAYSLETNEIKTFTAAECEFGYRESVFKRALKGKYVVCAVRLNLSTNKELNTSYGAIKSELEKLGDKEIGAREVADAVIAIRQSKLPDPKEIGNSGSFFKNPVIPHEQALKLKRRYSSLPMYELNDKESKLAAAWLIQKAGWKGYRVGDAGVHKNQALVLVNYDNAKGKEIWSLAQSIMSSVFRKFGIQLEPEVNVL